MNPAMPLEGITVVELGTSVAAPYATLALAEMGALVLKIEHPKGGDPARSWGRPITDGQTLVFAACNRDKKSIALDLSDADSRRRLRELIRGRADVVVQNLRPGMASELELDAEHLRAEKPELIYCNIGAFGASGPLSRLPGYDPLMQAFAGICHVTGPEDGEACRVGVPVIDLGTAMWAVIGIQAALLRRHATGIGGVVDVSLFETAVGWMSFNMSSVMQTGKAAGRYGTRGPGGLAPNRGYEASDGVLLITAGTNAQFRRLADVLGLPELAEDERFGTPVSRSRNEEAMSEKIAAVIRTETREYWMKKLAAAAVPSAPIHTPVEAFHHPQMQASGMIQSALDGSVDQIALPFKLEGERPPFRQRAPDLGEHNDLLPT